MYNEKYKGTDKLIKVGDNVMYRGEVDEIVGITEHVHSYNNYTLEGGGYPEYHVLEYLANKPHKYQDVFIALANGLEVEVKCFNKWHTMCLDAEYRIKPTTPPKSPKQLEKERIQKEMEKLAKDLEELDL
jgi:hypothetical protein